MPRLRPALRGIAALTAVVALIPIPAPASEHPVLESRYAAFLRTVNPHLEPNQSAAFARTVIANAERTRIDPQLLMALVTVESGWRPDAVSWAGARGLGQLMPETARTLGVNPRDPAQNLRGAARYLRAMIDRFASRGRDTLRLALGAYNAGPRAVEAFGGIPPYGETRNYVVKVLASFASINGRLGRYVPKRSSPDEAAWLASADASAAPDDASAPPVPALPDIAAVVTGAGPATQDSPAP